MSGTAGEQAARPGLACVACHRPFGCVVAFCPFCGAAQRPTAVAERPKPAVPAPPAPVPVARAPKPSPWGLPKPPGSVAPLVAAPLGRSAPVSGRRPPRRGQFLGLIGLGAVLLYFVVGALVPAPHGTVVTRVRTAGGAVVPDGAVLIDGQRAGTPGAVLTLSAGPHRVGYEEPGLRAETQAVTVPRDGAVTVNLVAREVPARLSLTTAPPGAAVRVGGRAYGAAPLELDLTPGTHEVSVSLPGYVSKTVTVRLERGESRALSIDLAATVAAPHFGPPPFGRGILAAGTLLLDAPTAGAATIDTLPDGAEVQVMGQVTTDGSWLQVRAVSRPGSGRPGFVRTGSVEAWDTWVQRNTVTGPIEGISVTLRVVLGGRGYALFGVQPPDRATLAVTRIAASLSNLLRGQQVRCVPQDLERFQCKTLEGRDVAEFYLLNGAAMTADGALPYYFEAQRSAREKQKGMWSE